MNLTELIDEYIESKIMAYMNSDEFGDKIVSIFEENIPSISETIIEEQVRAVVEKLSFSVDIGNVNIEVN